MNRISESDCRRLYLFTISFPYDSGQEANFIIPELPKLRQRYDEIIFVPAQLKGSLTFQLEQGMTIDIRLGLAFARRNRIVNFFSIRFLITWIQICFQIFFSAASGKLKLCYNALFFALRMNLSHRYLRELSGNFDLYTFWNTYVTAAMVQLPNFKGRCWTRVHGDDFYPERQGGVIPFEVRTYRKLDEIVFASVVSRDFFVSRHPAIQTKLSIAYIGVVVPSNWHFKVLLPKRNPMMFVTCSGLNPIKQLSLVNIWVKMWNTENLDAQIMWHHLGASTSELEKHIQTSCIGRGHSWMSQLDVLFWLQQNQPFAMLSLSKSEGGFPVSMQEALICGIPIIGAANGGVKEALQVSGGFYLPSEPEYADFARVIEKLNALTDNEILLIRQKAMEVGKTHFLR
jgi:hypothetical protein